jgi:hypothetical protein
MTGSSDVEEHHILSIQENHKSRLSLLEMFCIIGTLYRNEQRMASVLEKCIVDLDKHINKTKHSVLVHVMEFSQIILRSQK